MEGAFHTLESIIRELVNPINLTLASRPDLLSRFRDTIQIILKSLIQDRNVRVKPTKLMAQLLLALHEQDHTLVDIATFYKLMPALITILINPKVSFYYPEVQNKISILVTRLLCHDINSKSISSRRRYEFDLLLQDTISLLNTTMERFLQLGSHIVPKSYMILHKNSHHMSGQTFKHNLLTSDSILPLNTGSIPRANSDAKYAIADGLEINAKPDLYTKDHLTQVVAFHIFMSTRKVSTQCNSNLDQKSPDHPIDYLQDPLAQADDYLVQSGIHIDLSNQEVCFACQAGMLQLIESLLQTYSLSSHHILASIYSMLNETIGLHAGILYETAKKELNQLESKLVVASVRMVTLAIRVIRPILIYASPFPLQYQLIFQKHLVTCSQSLLFTMKQLESGFKKKTLENKMCSAMTDLELVLIDVLDLIMANFETCASDNAIDFFKNWHVVFYNMSLGEKLQRKLLSILESCLQTRHIPHEMIEKCLLTLMPIFGHMGLKSQLTLVWIQVFKILNEVEEIEESNGNAKKFSKIPIANINQFAKINMAVRLSPVGLLNKLEQVIRKRSMVLENVQEELVMSKDAEQEAIVPICILLSICTHYRHVNHTTNHGDQSSEYGHQKLTERNHSDYIFLWPLITAACKYYIRKLSTDNLSLCLVYLQDLGMFLVHRISQGEELDLSSNAQSCLNTFFTLPWALERAFFQNEDNHIYQFIHLCLAYQNILLQIPTTVTDTTLSPSYIAALRDSRVPVVASCLEHLALHLLLVDSQSQRQLIEIGLSILDRLCYNTQDMDGPLLVSGICSFLQHFVCITQGLKTKTLEQSTTSPNSPIHHELIHIVTTRSNLMASFLDEKTGNESIVFVPYCKGHYYSTMDVMVTQSQTISIPSHQLIQLINQMNTLTIDQTQLSQLFSIAWNSKYQEYLRIDILRLIQTLVQHQLYQESADGSITWINHDQVEIQSNHSYITDTNTALTKKLSDNIITCSSWTMEKWIEQLLVLVQNEHELIRQLAAQILTLIFDHHQALTLITQRIGPIYSELIFQKSQEHADAMIQQLSTEDLLTSKISIQNAASILYLVGEIGRVAQGNLLKSTLFLLLRYLSLPISLIQAYAFETIQILSQSHGLTPRELFFQFKEEMVWHLVKNFVNSTFLDHFCIQILSHTSAAFLNEHIHLIMSKLMLSNHRKELVKHLSLKLSISSPMLIMNSMESILIAIMATTTEDQDRVNGALAFLTFILNTTLRQLLERWKYGILSKIVLFLGKKQNIKRANTALACIIRMLDLRISSVDFLKHHFLLITSEIIHHRLLAPKISIEEKREAILAFKRLVKLVKPHLDSLYLKVITALKLIMTISPELLQLGCQVWLSFLKKLPIKQLRRVLGQVTVHLLAYIEQCESDLLPIFNYLFIEQFEKLCPYSKEVLLLPDRPAFAKIKAKCMNATKSPHSTAQMLYQIANHISLINNENDSVREMSVNKLIDFLYQNRRALNRIFSEREIHPSISEMVSEIFKGTRDPIQSIRVKFAQALGVLGAIDPGRLNVISRPRTPRLDLNIQVLAKELIQNYLVKYYRSANHINYQDRACYMIQEILNFFKCKTNSPVPNQMKNETNYDEHNPASVSSYGTLITEIWAQFDEETQVIIQPFLTSRYQIKTISKDIHLTENVHHRNGYDQLADLNSIYIPKMDYWQWIERWIRKLVTHSRVPFFQVFAEVELEEELGRFLLPHLLFSTLQNGTEKTREAILNEILSVIDAREPHEEINQMAVQTIFTLLDSLNNWIVSKILSLKSIQVREKTKTENGDSIVDIESEELSNKNVKIVQSLLSKIPQEALSRVAFKCSAYARSLLYLENAIRNEIQNNIDQVEFKLKADYTHTPLSNLTVIEDAAIEEASAEERMAEIRFKEYREIKQRVCAHSVAQLQLICEKLDDPDATLGLSYFRPQTTLEDMIIECRAAGRWIDAMIVLDQALHQMPHHIQVKRKLELNRLECLRELGLFDQINHLVKNFLMDPEQQSDAKHLDQLYGYGILASWRLGDWDRTQSLVDQVSSAAKFETTWRRQGPMQLGNNHHNMPLNFDTTLGKILLTMRTNDQDMFKYMIDQLRNDLVQPLAAASFESYQRSYPIIVHLHMLNELEESWNLLNSKAIAMPSIEVPQGSIHYLKENGPRYATHVINQAQQSILDDWHSRLPILQNSFKVHEPVLSLRVVTLDLCGLNGEANQMWMQMAKSARKSSRYQMAKYALLKVQDNGDQLACKIETAKLLWHSKQETLALLEIQKALQLCTSLEASTTSQSSHAHFNRKQNHPSTKTLEMNESNPELIAHYRNRLMLLRARWMQANHFAVSTISEMYSTITSNSEDAKAYYFHGRYFDQLAIEYKRNIYGKTSAPAMPLMGLKQDSDKLGIHSIRINDKPSVINDSSYFLPYDKDSFSDSQRISQYWKCIPQVFYMYYKSLKLSARYLNQILPRLLTMWLDIGDAYHELLDANIKTRGSHQRTTTNTTYQTIQRRSSTNRKLQETSLAGRKVPNDLNQCQDKRREGLPSSEKVEMKQVDPLTEAYTSCMMTMSELSKSLPPSSWFAAYSLLISGTSHTNGEVSELVIEILLLTLHHYPEQAMWSIVPMKHSAKKERKARYQEIVHRTLSHQPSDAKWKGRITHDYLISSEQLIGGLLEIFTWEPPKNNKHRVGCFQFQRACPILSQIQIPPNIIIPTEQQLSIVSSESHLQHRQVHLTGFGKDLIVLWSKQKPRRIKIKGDDGLEYPFLCKAGDDLRRDARMMEFNSLVNKFLREPETRRSSLNIRTYSVIALEEKKGLLSWVANTSSLKDIVGQMMRLEGLDLQALTGRVTMQFYSKNLQQEPGWVNQYINHVLPCFPSVLWKWFVFHFNEPSLWLRARTSYARTTAVMSIVGAALGLGDRHCENIMLDTETGECVHVDLNCIFYQGLQLQVPEVVPFRLTPNMVDALGVMGYEGIFRKSCELTLNMLRRHKDTLISVLESLIRDPFESHQSKEVIAVSTRLRKSNAFSMLQEQNREIIEILNSVSDRIDGIRGSPYNNDESLIPLSVEGHVDTLIKEATSVQRLSKMYVGWSSFI